MIFLNIKTKIKQIVNVFETSKIDGRYASCVVTHDATINGVGSQPQISYGRSQATEYGNLKTLLDMYIKNNGKYSVQLQPYMSQIGVTPLSINNNFIVLLKAAGNDSIMQQTQDYFFDMYYFNPAQHFFDNEGFTLALSLLVIYDSYIQSGGIMAKLRARFSELTPEHDGDEKKWIESYVNVRHDFLANNSNADVKASVYRMNCCLEQIKNDNWDLQQPVNAHFLTVN